MVKHKQQFSSMYACTGAGMRGHARACAGMYLYETLSISDGTNVCSAYGKMRD
jgi:hypothetical protein